MKLFTLLLLAVSFSASAALQDMSLKCFDRMTGDTILVEIFRDHPVVPYGDREVGSFYVRPVRFAATLENQSTDSFVVLSQNEFSVKKHKKYYVFTNKKSYEKYLCKKTGSVTGPRPPISPKPPVVTRSFTGELTQIYAIGGETTGLLLMTENQGGVELDGATNTIKNKLYNSIGATLTVTGSFETRFGVETGTRKVFVVTKVAERMIGPRPIYLH